MNNTDLRNKTIKIKSLNHYYFLFLPIFLYIFLYLDMYLNNFTISELSATYSKNNINEIEKNISSLNQFVPEVFDDLIDSNSFKTIIIDSNSKILSYNINNKKIDIYISIVNRVLNPQSKTIQIKSSRFENGELIRNYVFNYTIKKLNEDDVHIRFYIYYDHVYQLFTIPRKLKSLSKISKKLLYIK